MEKRLGYTCLHILVHVTGSSEVLFITTYAPPHVSLSYPVPRVKKQKYDHMDGPLLTVPPSHHTGHLLTRFYLFQ